ncbi:hypothetical protein pkur_cds_643 [Pandoravirus kuranda]|uniref:Uncharacterized protein n=1 Tax=Pandoravirus kuranda TaxID=3019033 RepID=A0AA95J3T3_9VIRU|nr:hypothetical protein pkur_cds_643 [Pandoravirus kuranda]
MDTSAPADRTGRLDTAASVLRAVSGSRLERDAARAQRAHNDALTAFMASLPCLDEQVHDWRARLSAIADARARLMNPLGVGGAPTQRAQTSPRTRPELDMDACTAILSDLGATVHAIEHDQTAHGDIRLICTDGHRRLAFDVHVVFGGAPTRRRVRVGAYVGVVVFLDTRRLMPFDAVLACAYMLRDITAGHAIYRSHTRPGRVAMRFMHDLIHSDAVDWASFARTRYRQLEALPEALSRHGWRVLPKDRSDLDVWSWHDGPHDELCSDKSIGIMRGDDNDGDDGVIWIVWSGGRLIATMSEMAAVYCCTDAPLFFDRLCVTARSAETTEEATAAAAHQNSPAPIDDWRLVGDLADREALLETERAWMIHRGFISPDTLIVPDAPRRETVRPRLVGGAADSIDAIVERIAAYAAYARGDYGPVDPTTGHHINESWCRRRLDEADLPTAYRARAFSGPIDPHGLVTTNWTFACNLSQAFACMLPFPALVDIVAHVHIVGHSDGTAGASFAVVVKQEHTYNDPATNNDDVAGSAYTPRRSKAAKTLETVRESLISALALAADAEETLDGDQPHPLIARNLQSLCASPSTRIVLVRRQCAGKGVDVPYALAWAITHVRSAMALFDDAAAHSLGTAPA